MEEKRYSSFGESLWRQRVYTKRVWHNPNQPVRNYLTHFIPLKKKKKTIESREWEFIGRVSTLRISWILVQSHAKVLGILRNC